MIALVHHGDEKRGRAWREVFAHDLPDVDFRCWPDIGNASEVRYLVAWTLDDEVMSMLPNLEILFSIGAGIDQLDIGKVPDHVRIVRMIDPGITQTMAEYVAMGVLALHRDLPRYVDDQRSGRWFPRKTLLCRERSVGLLGLGELGTAALAALAPFGFRLSGWSRTRRSIEGVECYAGPDEMDGFLARSEILVCLLPLTPDTRGILCRDLFEKLPRGASLLNAARGGHLINDDLVDALDNGRLSAALLDVCDPEPLPETHPFRGHPSIFVTPHVAGITRIETAVHSLIANLQREASGLSLAGEVDRSRGY